jgi:hypothetical protein
LAIDHVIQIEDCPTLEKELDTRARQNQLVGHNRGVTGPLQSRHVRVL